MSDLPFWAYPAITFLGLLCTGGAVYLMATSRRNTIAKTISVVAEDGHVIGTGVMRHRRDFREVTLDVLEVVGNQIQPASTNRKPQRRNRADPQVTADASKKP